MTALEFRQFGKKAERPLCSMGHDSIKYPPWATHAIIVCDHPAGYACAACVRTWETTWVAAREMTL